MNYTKEYFDFDLDRKNTRSMKWDDCNSKFGVDESTAMIPMWIADMDFRSPKEVIDAVIDRALDVMVIQQNQTVFMKRLLTG